MRDALSLSGNQALLTRANPLAKFAAVFLITLVLALSIDWMSASVALACELLLFPLAGLTFTLLWQRGWPLIVAAAVGGWSTSILSPPSRLLDSLSSVLEIEAAIIRPRAKLLASSVIPLAPSRRNDTWTAALWNSNPGFVSMAP